MKKRRSSKKNSSAKLWLITLLLIALLAIILIYLQKKSASFPPSEQNRIATKTKVVTKQQPKFDFYTVLPQAKNNAAPPPTFGTLETPTAKQPIAPTVKVPANKSPSHFVLQIAAVKEYAEADRLKAELTLLGYNVTIQKVVLHNITWNRVNLGPYASLQAAKAAQSELEKNRIKSILISN